MQTLRSIPTAGQPRPPTKIERVLVGLLDGWKSSRELELPPYFDHCANATAADLKRQKCEIEAERIMIPGYQGIATSIARYRVPETGRAFALELLEQMRARRGAGK